MIISVLELATQIEGEARGDSSAELSAATSIAQARPGSVTFAENAKQFQEAIASGATAIITSRETMANAGAAPSKSIICVEKPRAAFAKAVGILLPKICYEASVHPTAILGAGVQVGSEVHIGPYAVIKDNVQIGDRAVIDAGAIIGEGTLIGEGCVIHPRVTIYPHAVIGRRVVIHAGAVIGSDGFGYTTIRGEHLKVPQIGNVVLEDDVEIGANTTIDRAMLDSTRIKHGTKIDNLVQIAHNCTVGEHCLIAAQAGLAGSVRLGRHVMLGGQVGVADHRSIGDEAMIGAQGGVIHDVPGKSASWGTPTQPKRDWLRQLAALRRLPGLLKELRAKKLIGAKE